MRGREWLLPESGIRRDLRGHAAQASSPGPLFSPVSQTGGYPASVGIQFPKAAFLLGDVVNGDDGSDDVDDGNSGDDDGDVMMVTVYHLWNVYLSSGCEGVSVR